MIALTLIPMLAALGLQAADAVPAEDVALAHEPEIAKRRAMTFPPEAARYNVVARCNVTMDIGLRGRPLNMCAACNTATPHDFVNAEDYEEVYVRFVLRDIRLWRFEPTETGFHNHTQNFDYNLAHLSPDLLASIETPAAPVCE